MSLQQKHERVLEDVGFSFVFALGSINCESFCTSETLWVFWKRLRTESFSLKWSVMSSRSNRKSHCGTENCKRCQIEDIIALPRVSRLDFHSQETSVCGSRSYQINLQILSLRLLLLDHFRQCSSDIELIEHRGQEVTHESCEKLTTLPVDFVAILVNQSTPLLTTCAGTAIYQQDHDILIHTSVLNQPSSLGDCWIQRAGHFDQQPLDFRIHATCHVWPDAERYKAKTNQWQRRDEKTYKVKLSGDPRPIVPEHSNVWHDEKKIILWSTYWLKGGTFKSNVR
jgi:hypothetical protein